MEHTYYLWSTAMQGWAGPAGYTTELKDATPFSRHQAMARCILHFRKSEITFGLLMINEADLIEIRGDK